MFDTNVLVSALLLPDSRPRKAVERALQNGRVLLSHAAPTELYDVLSRKQFGCYIDEEDVRTFVAVLTRAAEWGDVDVRIRTCRDSKDDKFLELGISGHATHIVTGDSDLLVLAPFRGIWIVPPEELLKD